MTRKRLAQLLERMPRRMARRYLQIVERVRSKWVLAELEKAVEAGPGALQALLDDLAAATTGVTAFAAGVHTAVGAEVAEYLSARLDQLVAYDVAAPRTVALLQAQRMRMIVEITEAQREAISDILRDGYGKGLNPRAVAVEIRDVIGLDSYRAGIVRNYRRALEAGERKALGYALRDARSDRTVRAAVEGAKPLSQAQIDKLVGRYAERQLASRAEAIARTESLRAIHSGQEESWQQAVDDGKLPVDRIQMEWLAGGAPRTRESHRKMRGQRRKWGETFRSGAGYALRYPCDPDAPASETVRCRCGRIVRVLPVGQAPIGEAEERAAAATAAAS